EAPPAVRLRDTAREAVRTRRTAGRDDRAPDFARIQCPRCRWQPRALDRWTCAPCGPPEAFVGGCGTHWDTFTTRGVCPGCGHRWQWTACPACREGSPHDDWYVDAPG